MCVSTIAYYGYFGGVSFPVAALRLLVGKYCLNAFLDIR